MDQKIGSDKVFKKIGILAHTNTKYKGVVNMRYWVNELRAVKIRDINTLNELRGFVRYPNGTWAAKPGADSWDDRIMSLVWCLVILENELVDTYFEVLELDDNRRPLKLKSLDYGIKHFINPTSIYSNEKNPEITTMPLPVMIQGSNNQDNNDIDDLAQQGWTRLN